MRLIPICIALFLNYSLYSQEFDFLNIDTIYNDDIKTVQLKVRGGSFPLPVLDLDGRGTLDLYFDDLDVVDKDYIYYIYHCDRNWEISDLDEVEYLDGFNGEEIRNVTYSETAYSNYTNYRLSLPNDDMRWTISGNYMLIIVDEELQEVVLSRRFIVFERKVGIQATVGRATQALSSGDYHEVSVDINPQKLNVREPMSEITATVLQNGRWDNAALTISPKFLRGNRIVFNEFNKMIFPALNEFRNFGFSNDYGYGHWVDSYYREGGEIYVLLNLDHIRSGIHYIENIDFNGSFLNRRRIEDLVEVNALNEDVSPYFDKLEYGNVLFTLNTKRDYYKTDIYIIGKFSDWQLKEEYRMEYDADTKSYLGSAFLKEGYYDYMYAKVTDGAMSIADIEGNWMDAENDYSVLIYYHPFGSRYDRLVGVNTISSRYDWRNR